MVDTSLFLLDALSERMPMGIVVINRDFRIIHCDPTWVDFVEYYIGTGSGPIVPSCGLFHAAPDIEPFVRPLLERVFRGETSQLQAVHLTTQGDESYWDLLPVTIGGETVAILGVSLEANGRHRLSQSLLESETKFRLLFEKSADGMLLLDGETILDANPAALKMMGYADIDALKRLAPHEFSPFRQPDDRISVEKYHEVVAEGMASGSHRFEWVHRRADGADFPVEVQLVVIQLAGQDILHVTWRDITERVLSRDELEAAIALRTLQLERKQAVAASLADILKVINSSRSQPEVLDYIVEQARRLMEANVCVLHHVDYEDRFVNIEASSELPDELLDVPGFPLEFGGADALILAAQPAVLGDMPTPPPGQPLDSDVRRWQHVMGTAFRAFLATPLVLHDRVYGSLAFYFDEPHEFQAEEIELATSLSDQAALAIENARLRQDAKSSAVAAERNRLARELHDAVTQTLFSASLIAEVLPQIWEKDDDAGRERLGELRELTRGALAEMRTLLLELRPATLADSRLESLLKQLAEGMTGRSRVASDVTVSGKGDLPVEVKVVFYRIAQESLANVARHATASRVDLVLVYQPDLVTLTITDDGQGFDPNSVSPTSLGLSIMHERASSIGAKLVVDSSPGRGTTVTLHWPVDVRQE